MEYFEQRHRERNLVESAPDFSWLMAPWKRQRTQVETATSLCSEEDPMASQPLEPMVEASSVAEDASDVADSGTGKEAVSGHRPPSREVGALTKKKEQKQRSSDAGIPIDATLSALEAIAATEGKAAALHGRRQHERRWAAAGLPPAAGGVWLAGLEDRLAVRGPTARHGGAPARTHAHAHAHACA